MALKCTRFTQSGFSAVGKLVRFPSILFLRDIELIRTSFNGFGVKWFYFIHLFCKTGTSCLGYILDRRNINICKPSSRPRTVSPPLWWLYDSTTGTILSSVFCSNFTNFRFAFCLLSKIIIIYFYFLPLRFSWFWILKSYQNLFI